jgi:hypothetical protein
MRPSGNAGSPHCVIAVDNNVHYSAMLPSSSSTAGLEPGEVFVHRNVGNQASHMVSCPPTTGSRSLAHTRTTGRLCFRCWACQTLSKREHSSHA